MADEKSSIIVLRKADLEAGDPYAGWEDPVGIARLSDAKRQAILDNPLSTNPDDPVQIIGLRGSTVVGKMDLIAGSAMIAGQNVPLLWTSALVVPEQFRNTLMGAFIVLKMQQLSPTVAACAVSAQALPLYEKLKWTHLRMHRHILLRRSKSVVQKYLGDGIGAKIAAAGVDAALALHRAMTRPIAAIQVGGLRCQTADTMDESLDAALARHDRPAAFHRSATFINWLLRRSVAEDSRDQRGLFFVLDAAGRRVAYFLLKARFYPVATHRQFKNLYLGTLADWGILESGAVSLAQIVRLSTRELGRWNVDAIEVCLADGEDAGSLKASGFISAGDLHLFVKGSAKSPAGEIRFQNPLAWSIRPAEGDNFLI